MNDSYIKVMDLNVLSPEEKQQFESNINYRKEFSQRQKDAKAFMKSSKCFYCNESVESFCNSHSIPAFCLRNIANDGKVLTINTVINVPVLKKETGIKETGTFQMICRKCDSYVFSDYENPDNYNELPTQKMMAQISLKNNLKFISKRKNEIGLHHICRSEMPFIPIVFEDDYVESLDLKEYMTGCHKAKNALEKERNGYYLCYYRKLNYVVPLAFQSSVALVFDFDGVLINEIYNTSPDYKVRNINICVFPLETESVIMMFIEDNDKRYRKFYKQLNKLDLENQLAAITFIMFAYSEEVYFSKHVKDKIVSNGNLTRIISNGQNIVANTLDFNPYEMIKDRYDLTKRNEIPNLLLETYKIR